MREYAFIRDAGPDDWRALPRPFKAGEKVTRYSGHTYGIERDDLMYGGVNSIACTVEGHDGFFTVPIDFLTDEKGERPMPEYVLVQT